MRIRQLDLWNYKAYERFTLDLGTSAFLVGPNNAGKSTLVAAIRAASAMIQQAARRRPTGHTKHGHKSCFTHQLRADQYGLVTENLRHQFRSAESAISIKTDTDLRLTAVWPEAVEGEYEPFFYLEHTDGRPFREPKQVRSQLGLIGIVPGLYPINQTENILDPDYVGAQLERRRSSQHARNQIHLIEQAGEMDSFREFALEWLPEIEDIQVSSRLGVELGDREVDVYLRERGDRTQKELFWAGDGMQIFVQLLTHLWRLRAADVVVLDEPDLYLHADLQRRLVRLLEATDAQTITATHSAEMLAEASSESVTWVDKSRRRGVRRPAAATLEDLSTQIGSNFNLRLAGALRARTIIFVEGNDMSVVRSLAKTVGASNLATERNCSVIEIKGFSNWVQVEPFQWFVSDFLEDAVEVFVLLDRDYRADTEVETVRAALHAVGVRPHVWERKELENYLLIPSAISRISSMPLGEVEHLLSKITDEMTDDVLSQFAARRHDSARSSGQDMAVSFKDALREIRPQATQPDWRIQRYPAKQILNAVNTELQQRGLRTVAVQSLAKTMKGHEIPEEMLTWIYEVDRSAGRLGSGL